MCEREIKRDPTATSSLLCRPFAPSVLPAFSLRLFSHSVSPAFSDRLSLAHTASIAVFLCHKTITKKKKSFSNMMRCLQKERKQYLYLLDVVQPIDVRQYPAIEYVLYYTNRKTK